MTDQRTCIDPLDSDDAVLLHINMQRLCRAPIARHRRILFDDEAFDKRLVGFYVLRVDADVADLRISHGHELAFV